MILFLNAFSFSLMLTVMFAFRLQYTRQPKVLVPYFVSFFAVELVAGAWIPKGALGLEVTGVCLTVTVLFIAAILISARAFPSRTEDGETRASGRPSVSPPPSPQDSDQRRG